MYRHRSSRILSAFFTNDYNFRWIVIIPILIVFAIASLAIADFIYGDWKCAFAECRIVKVDK